MTNGKFLKKPETSQHQEAYYKHLVNKLSNTKDYTEFSDVLKNEIDSYDITNWAYTPLNLPTRLTAAEQLGNISEQFVADYVGEELYKWDMVLEYANSSKCHSHVYQSDIESFVNKAPVKTRSILGQQRIIEKNRQAGLEEILNIPLTSSIDGSKFLFCLTSENGNPSKFKDFTSKKISNFLAIARAVNYTGVKYYPDKFLAVVNKHKKLINSQPFNLLATMVAQDLSISDCAKKVNLSRQTVANHLGQIKKEFDRKTIYSAYKVAKDLSLLD